MRLVGIWFLSLGLCASSFSAISTLTKTNPKLKNDAIFLLTLGSGEPSEERNRQLPKRYDTPEMLEALKTLAIELEIWDSREENEDIEYCNPYDFVTLLTELQKRYWDLKDAPRTGESLSFPSEKTIIESIDFNRRFRSNVVTELGINQDRPERFKEAIKESDELYQFWSLVRTATSESNFTSERRYALKAVKEWLGDEDYYLRNLPPTVPTWRFRELN